MTQYDVLLFSPSVAKDIGLNEAIILRQLYYWQSKYPSNKWIYNSYQDWQKQFNFWSLRTIQRTFISLEEQGLIHSKRAKTCKFYQLRLEKVKKFFVDEEVPKWHLRSAKMARPINRETKTKTKNSSLSLLSQKRKAIPERELKELIEIWKSFIAPTQKELTLTPKRAEKLGKVFEKFFVNDLGKWEEFVKTIQKSDFLMGKITNFKISLDWILKEENLIKALEDNYKNKTVEAEEQQKLQEKEVVLELEQDNRSDHRWKALQQNAIKKFGTSTYVSWFSKMKLISCEENAVRVGVPTRFIKDWIESKYGNYFLQMSDQCFNGNRMQIEVLQGTHQI
jgi:hypothetical protein